MGGVLLAGPRPRAGIYYNAHPIGQMDNHLTMLAYDMNDQPLSYRHGEPLRLLTRSGSD